MNTSSARLRNRAESWPGVGPSTASPGVVRGLWETRVFWLVLAHVPLGVLVLQSPLVATVHAVLVLGFGLVSMMRSTDRGIAVCAYISGSEVLWRMGNSPIPYEFGKYATILLCGVGLVRLGRKLRWRWLPPLYFAFLLPSTLASLADATQTPHAISDALRFYLSGPLALCMSVWLLSQVRIGDDRMRDVLIGFVAPAVAIASAMAAATVTATSLVFNTESNMITSGGFGPNQVSAALGLAAVASLFLTLDPKASTLLRRLSLVLIVVLCSASAMTFSRGGLYGAAVTAICGCLYLARLPKVRRRLTFAVTSIAVIGTVLIWPRLNRFTSGALGERFSDMEPTHRGILMLDDLRMFTENPILGVGPGRAPEHRVLVSYGMGHTEPSRMLGEHGIGGAISVLLLIIMAIKCLSQRGSTFGRGVRASMLAWSLASMLHLAMRIAAVSFVFGLAHAKGDDARETP